MPKARVVKVVREAACCLGRVDAVSPEKNVAR